MRKITADICRAYARKQPFKGKNTRTDGFTVVLHNSTIFKRENHAHHFTLAGWPTPTTLDRINGLLREVNADFRLCQHKGEVRAYPTGMLMSSLKPRQWPVIDPHTCYEVRDMSCVLSNLVFGPDIAA